jgi:hypothetical protein
MYKSLVGFVMLAGCVDDAALEVETEVVSQELAGWSIYGLVCTSGSCGADLGTSTNRTCFLGGVTGHLNGSAEQYDYSLVTVSRYGGTYTLGILANGAGPVGATAVCINTSLNRIDNNIIWHSYDPPVTITGGTAARRCFLSQVAVADGMGTTFDHVAVTKDAANNNWYLGGYQHDDAFADAKVVCVDVPELVTQQSQVQGAGSTSYVLGDNTTACGLQRIGGVFTSNNTDEGVNIKFMGGAVQQWYWQLKNYKNGFVSCVR